MKKILISAAITLTTLTLTNFANASVINFSTMATNTGVTTIGEATFSLTGGSGSGLTPTIQTIGDGTKGLINSGNTSSVNFYPTAYNLNINFSQVVNINSLS